MASKIALTVQDIINGIFDNQKVDFNIQDAVAGELGRYSTHAANAGGVNLKDPKFKAIEDLAEEVLDKKEALKEADRKWSVKSMKEKVKKGERLLKKDAKEVFRDIREAEKHHERALKVLGEEGDLAKAPERLIKKVTKEAEERLEKIAKDVDALYDGQATGFKSTAGHKIDGVDFGGLTKNEAEKVVQQLEQNLANAQSDLEAFVEKKIAHHVDELEKIGELRGNIEEAIGKKSADLIGKTESTLVSTAEKEAGQLENAAKHSKLLGGAVGMALGAATANLLTGNEEDKTRNTIVGGVVGTGLGIGAQVWRDSKAVASSLGSSMHGRGVMQDIAAIAGHVRA